VRPHNTTPHYALGNENEKENEKDNEKVKEKGEGKGRR
jgi:hypothetical protein